MEVDLRNDLFLCPVYYDSEPCGGNGIPLPLNAPDDALHFTADAAKMHEAGARVVCLDGLPAKYVPAAEPVGGKMYFRKITAPDGSDYVPLFMHYQAITGIFGQNIHIGIVSFADVRQICMDEQNIAGIVLAPGSLNRILTREMLMQL